MVHDYNKITKQIGISYLNSGLKFQVVYLKTSNSQDI